jgi:hypothetical protein
MKEAAMDNDRSERLSRLFKALADPARLRILGLLAEMPMAGHQLADGLGLTPPTISHHMRRLVDAGLVTATPDAQSRIYSLQLDAFRNLAQPPSAPSSSATSNTEEDAVLRAFFDGPRLRHLPAARKKRVIVLRRLLERFDPDRSYPEREVNDMLREAHDDVATLRRELVDYGFMNREHGVYRVAARPPPRGATVSQEVGDESRWFPELIAKATMRALGENAPQGGGTRSAPTE